MINDLRKEDFPQLLKEIPDPPEKLRIIGQIPNTEKYLSIVGSRKYSDYGKHVCEKLILGLRGYSITIVSGLALGIDSIGHRSALKAGLKTIAVPGSGLSDKFLYPSSHLALSREIVRSGGCLISEFSDNTPGYPSNFPQRNRIIAGLSNATLVIEAEIKSGTLITSKYAIDYNREVMTVPNSIFSKTAEGPHMLLKLGATPITSSEDILLALGYKLDNKNKLKNFQKNYSDCSKEEKEIIEILKEPLSRDELIRKAGNEVYITQTILASMEIKGIIEEILGEIHLK